MSTSASNPHKKGEHVFNDIATSIGNAFEAALSCNRANSLLLTGPFGPLRLADVPGTASALEQLRRDPVLAEARTVVAPATGTVNDENSRLYSAAKMQLERLLSDLVVSTAALLWKKKPRSGSSFHEFESIVSGMRDSRLLAGAARTAMGALIDAAHDPAAEAAALSERAGDAELARRKTAIMRMHQYRPALKEFGASVVDTFAGELEGALERRIGRA